jgi:magnesium-transporting ATPase (P-type)
MPLLFLILMWLSKKNMLFASTLVVSGRAVAVVTETGMNTQVGEIARMIMTDEESMTPLQERLAQIGKVLGIGAQTRFHHLLFPVRTRRLVS